MPTRNVVLTDHQQEFIETLVRSGRYQNASEVLREGLRLVEGREAEEAEEAEEAAKLAALQAAAEIGWRDIQAGRYRDVAREDLADYIGQLGTRAAAQAARRR